MIRGWVGSDSEISVTILKYFEIRQDIKDHPLQPTSFYREKNEPWEIMQFAQGQASRNVRQDLIATTPLRGCFQSHFIVFKYNTLDLNRNRMPRESRWQSEREHMKERQKQWRLRENRGREQTGT